MTDAVEKAMEHDKILDEMADEFHTALIAAGANPKEPPADAHPPSAAAFAEYQRRGGEFYSDPDVFIHALIERVTTL
jgi:hypothetical protein